MADATDAALLGDKAYVVTGNGDLLVIDTDTGDQPLDVMPWKERLEHRAGTSQRTARKVEVVGQKPLALWSDASLENGKTRLYDYSFAAPKLAWESNLIYDLAAVAEGVLYLAQAGQLYASDGGTSAPVLERAFAANIRAVAREGANLYVALQSGAIWKRSTPSGAGGEGSGTPLWTLVKTFEVAAGAIGLWQGGANEERALVGLAQTGGAGYEANRLRSESAAGNWSRDRLLPVPEDRSVDAVLSMARSIGPARNIGAPHSGSEAEAAESLQVADSMAIGTSGDGLLYIYTQTHLDARYGAFEACSIGVPRIVPVWRAVAA